MATMTQRENKPSIAAISPTEIEICNFSNNKTDKVKIIISMPPRQISS
jgi:hypothetical protein